MADNNAYQHTGIGRCVRPLTGNKRTYVFPKLLHDRYEVESVLCIGGVGILIKAHDTRLFNRLVLIKTFLIPPSALRHANDRSLVKHIEDGRKYLEHERKMYLHAQLREISRLPVLIDWFEEDSPYIYGPHQAENGHSFTVDDPTLWKNIPYLVISFIEGRPMDEAFAQLPKLKNNLVKSLAALGRYLATTLQRFHDERNFNGKPISFIYQDLKPANLLYTQEGFFILIDLGSFAVRSGSQVVQTGTVSEGFAPPEYHTNHVHAFTPAFDVYSLGMVFKHCIQYAAGNMRPDSNLAPAKLKISKDWQELIRRCTDADIRQRYQTMRDVEKAIKQCREGEPHVL